MGNICGITPDLKFGLGVVLEVFAVSKDFAGFDEGDWLAETFLLADFRVLHPWLKHLP